MLRRTLVLLLALLLCLTGCTKASGTALVEVMKIGKADAILIVQGETAILIDAGEADDGPEILKTMRKRGVSELAAMVITHYDQDHVGGAADVLRSIPVSAVYDANYEASSDEYLAYTTALDEKKVTRTRVMQAQTLTFGGIEVTLLPSGVNTKQDNDLSMALSVTVEGVTLFFAGDAEEARIDELLASDLAHHDVLKLPHHGRYHTNLAELIDLLSPTLAVITDSDKNPADQAVLDLLSERGIPVRETRGGNIVMIIENGKNTVNQ